MTECFRDKQTKRYGILTKLYKIYKDIGGYPAVVRTYLVTGNPADCYKEIQSVFERFTEESASYFQDDKCAMVFQNVYKAAFMTMAKEKRGTSSKDIRDVTEFIRSDTDEHISRREVNDAIAGYPGRHRKAYQVNSYLYGRLQVPLCRGRGAWGIKLPMPRSHCNELQPAMTGTGQGQLPPGWNLSTMRRRRRGLKII